MCVRCAFVHMRVRVCPPAGEVEAELLHTYSRIDPYDTLILCVRMAVLVAVTLTVPIVLFPVSRLLLLPLTHHRGGEVKGHYQHTTGGREVKGHYQHTTGDESHLLHYLHTKCILLLHSRNVDIYSDEY